ncbi:MAG: hypothetical protein ABF415_05900 [Leuconostoc pseudomesenteroides]|uniref:hypothetical protein n=1 Tax=Leuconostoc pseudomesenteroides TaxID=33968 RepID=UPI0039E9A196
MSKRLELLPEKSNLKFIYFGMPDNGRPQFLIEGSDADALTVTPIGKLPEGLKPRDEVKFENLTLDLVAIGGSRTKVSGLTAVIKKGNEPVNTDWANEPTRTMVVVKGEYVPVVDTDFFTGSFMYGTTRDVFGTLNYQEQQDRGSRVGDLIAKDVRVSDENGKAITVRVPVAAFPEGAFKPFDKVEFDNLVVSLFDGSTNDDPDQDVLYFSASGISKSSADNKPQTTAKPAEAKTK